MVFGAAASVARLPAGALADGFGSKGACSQKEYTPKGAHELEPFTARLQDEGGSFDVSVHELWRELTRTRKR